jgi:hypothetical protein
MNWNSSTLVTVGGGTMAVLIGAGAWAGLFHVLDSQTALVAGTALIVGGLSAFGVKVALDAGPTKP